METTSTCVGCGNITLVRPCSVCTKLKFCESCMISENHTGIFYCNTCDKHICNSYQVVSADDSNTVECWSCVIQRRSKLISKSVDEIKENTTDDDTINIINDIFTKLNNLIDKSK